MLDLQLVENTIQELENENTTFSNCDKLASLYIVRHFHNEGLKTVVNAKEKEVMNELSDILPSYSMYCEKKRDFQLNKLGADVVLSSLTEVCREITEFIHMLYSSTDLPEERTIIVGKFTNMQF